MLVRLVNHFKRLNLWLGLASVLLLVIVCLQAKYIRDLKADVEEFASRGRVERGIAVPGLDALDLAGKRTLLDYAASRVPTIIYVFRPGCPWCEMNDKAIRSLIGKVSDRYRVVGLSLTGTGLTGFLKAHPLHCPVYHDPSASVVASLQLGTTPETIVASPAGRILASWNGAYMDGTRDPMEKFLSVSP